MYIYGSTIFLRRAEQEDLPIIYELCNNPDLEVPAYGFGLYPRSKAELEEEFIPTEQFKDRDTERFVICLNDDSKTVIGYAMIYDTDRVNRSCWTGVIIGKDYWGKEYGTETQKALLEFCFQYFNMNRIYGSCLIWNNQSIRLNEKLGTKIVGRLKQEAYVNGKYEDLVLLSTSREDFYNKIS